MADPELERVTREALDAGLADQVLPGLAKLRTATDELIRVVERRDWDAIGPAFSAYEQALLAATFKLIEAEVVRQSTTDVERIAEYRARVARRRVH